MCIYYCTYIVKHIYIYINNYLDIYGHTFSDNYTFYKLSLLLTLQKISVESGNENPRSRQEGRHPREQVPELGGR